MSSFLRLLTGLRALLLIPLVTAFYGLCAIVVCAFDPVGKIANRWLARSWGRAMMRAAGVRMRVEGLDGLGGSEGPFIIAFNHSSHLDIPALYAALPLQIRFVAKAELMRVPILGQAMKRLGNIVIDRKNRAQAIAGLKQAERMMREHRLSVVMAPEGTRSPDGRLLPFKKGAFVLAVDTHIPVLPVTLVGAATAMPRGTLLSRGGELRVVVGAPIPTGGMTYADRERLMAAVRGEMEKHL
jgi:1-acyl-sn-glycerol-3-phosphate acyltransferase